MFVHLNVRSNFSFGHGASTVEDLLVRANELGITALALTDLNRMSGAVAFFKKASELGIKAILGATIDDPGDEECQVILLAKNMAGFGEINTIITERKLDENFDLLERLKAVTPNVFVLSHHVDVLNAADHLKYRGRLYGEIVYRSRLDIPQCRAVAAFCRARTIPMVATGAVSFARPEDFEKHKLLSAIFQNTSLKWAKLSATEKSYLRSPAEMEHLFEKMPEYYHASGEIARQCEVDLRLGELKFPQYPDLPEDCEPFEHLREISETGLNWRYDGDPPEDARSRLAYELGVIDRLGFTEYFLIVYDIKEQAVRWEMPFVGRGSAANSLVSYCLGFTEVDPIKHNLYFERFLNPYRKSPPDIDLDFSWKDRDKLLQFVYDRYGHDRVAMICTTVTFGPRAALRETAKVMGFSEAEISRVTKRVPHFSHGDYDSIKETNPESKDLPIHIEPWKSVFRIAEGIIGYPRHLSIHAGGIVISPGKMTDWVPMERARKGFVVTQYDMYPIEDIGLVKIDLLSQRSLGVLTDALKAVKKNYGHIPEVDDFEMITQDEKTRELVREGGTMGCFYVESPGMRSLLKKLGCESFELLTAASSVIRPGVAESGMMGQFIRRHRGEEPVEYLHPKMEELLGETYGVMIYQEDVIKVAHYIAGISLGEADLLRRAMSGKERSPHKMKAMEHKFLRGCIANGVSSNIAQEIWRQVESFAGYAFCKAHSASFAVLSFKVTYMKAHYPAEFMAAVLANGGGFYSPAAYIEEAKRMGVKIELPDVNLSEVDCTGVSFDTLDRDESVHERLADVPRGAAVSSDCTGVMYGKPSGRGAACYALTNGQVGGDESGKGVSRNALTNTDNNDLQSEGSFTVSRHTGELRLGFQTILNLKEETMKKIVAEREHGFYTSLSDFLRRTGTGHKETGYLIKAGAFDFLMDSRATLLTRLEAMKGRVSSEINGLFDLEESLLAIPEAREYNAREIFNLECDTFGYPVTTHPLEFIPEEEKYGLVPAADIEKHRGKYVKMLGWAISHKRIKTKKTNEYMKFLSLEDLSGTFEVTLFPKAYKRLAVKTRDRGPYLVKGKIEDDSGVLSLVCEELESVWAVNNVKKGRKQVRRKIA
ncbi:MAG: DNA polymerase III subunit alpha [FCB group bacterium]|nr:DNA polymerase III subunit alpha [FCB group bacterium]